MAAGWCQDATPWDPVVFEGNCPTADIADVLNIPADSSVALYSHNGTLVDIINSGYPSSVMVTFGQSPLLIAWGGTDSDSDGIADISDNCIGLANPSQTENSAEGFLSSAGGAVHITAPDGIGDACDSNPDTTDP